MLPSSVPAATSPALVRSWTLSPGWAPTAVTVMTTVPDSEPRAEVTVSSGCRVTRQRGLCTPAVRRRTPVVAAIGGSTSDTWPEASVRPEVTAAQPPLGQGLQGDPRAADRCAVVGGDDARERDGLADLDLVGGAGDAHGRRDHRRRWTSGSGSAWASGSRSRWESGWGSPTAWPSVSGSGVGVGVADGVGVGFGEWLGECAARRAR